MAVATRIIRVANPRRRRTSNVRRRKVSTTRNRKGRFVKRKGNVRRPRVKNRRVRRTNGPVIRRYSTKNLKNELKRRGAKTNPRRKRHIRRKVNTRRRPNPVLIELGAVNPRRRKNVATKRRRKSRNPRRRRHVKAVARVHRRRRRRNPVVVVHRRRRNVRRRSVSRRRVHHRRRRNPALFGRSGGKDLLMMTGGVLVGVAATKFLPTMIPASLTSGLGTSPMISVAITGAGAFAAGWLARKFVGGSFGDAVLLGGLAQTGSALLNAFAPASIAGRLALSGVGDIVPGYFPVPQNPITGRMAVMPAPSGGGGGMGAFRSAFGGRR